MTIIPWVGVTRRKLFNINWHKRSRGSIDSNDMLRQDAGKGLENIKFEDWNDPSHRKQCS